MPGLSLVRARSGIFLILLLGVFALAALPVSGTLRNRAWERVAAQDVRSAVPLVEAYGADHDTFSGLTVDALRSRSHQPAVSHVFALDGGRRYCIDRFVNRAVASIEGPGGRIVQGKACDPAGDDQAG
jgi:hypothetical protein